MTRLTRTLTVEERKLSHERAKQGLCRQCGLDVHRFSPKRRTFCSDECVHEYRVRTDSGYARHAVYLREHGICQQCGLNCSSWFSQFRKFITSYEIKQLVWHYGTHRECQEFQNAIVEHYFELNGVPYYKGWRNRRTFWDVDHIIEVCRGGGSCGLDNLQLLCVNCHKAKTGKLLRKKS